MKGCIRYRAWVLILLLAVLPGQGRVFWRWRGRAHAGRAIESLGAARAYSAPVSVNGGKGQLDIYAMDAPFATAMRRLGKALDVSFGDTEARSMVIRTLETPSGILRLVAIVSSDVTRTLVFALQQSHAEAKRSQEGPPTSAGRDVPAFPGSQTVFTAADRRAKAELLVASTRAAPHAVRRFYHDHLTTSGWMPALPTGEGHIAGGVYLRDRTICYVQATAQATETHIAVLCKELSTKPEP